MVFMKKSKLAVILGIVFVVISLYALSNKGDMPDFLSNCEGNVCTNTFFGIVLLIVFPYAILGLTLEGAVSNNLFILIVIVVQFIYGYLIGLIIERIKK